MYWKIGQKILKMRNGRENIELIYLINLLKWEIYPIIVNENFQYLLARTPPPPPPPVPLVFQLNFF